MPNKRLVDANALISVMTKERDNAKDPVVMIHQTYDKRGFELVRAGWRRAMRVVHEAPTVDPVVHGEWIATCDENKKRCSKCDVIHFIAQYPDGNINYCPNCGAKMDGGKKNG